MINYIFSICYKYCVNTYSKRDSIFEQSIMDKFVVNNCNFVF